MNAAGSLGFAPNPHTPFDLSRLGAFVTNPISLTLRTPAQERACLPYPAAFYCTQAILTRAFGLSFGAAQPAGSDPCARSWCTSWPSMVMKFLRSFNS